MKMTREEAIRKTMIIKDLGNLPAHGPRYEEIAVAIDVFVALGMLKLYEYEEETPFDQLEKELKSYLSDKAVDALFGWMDENKIDVVRR